MHISRFHMTCSCVITTYNVSAITLPNPFRTRRYLYVRMPVILSQLKSFINDMTRNAYEVCFGRVRVGLT